MAAAGVDFVFICTEHSSFNLETVVDMVAHAHAAGITPMIRIPEVEYQAVTRLLDSGCQTLLAPHVKTGAEIRRFVELAKYHPEGQRGMAIYGAGLGVPTSTTHFHSLAESFH
jgi:2-dehydro-3-deoxyglucarate aldolase/4-hydroxy-2-oxoheptanedioate aldolase